jgi:hypothetical protein
VSENGIELVNENVYGWELVLEIVTEFGEA